MEQPSLVGLHQLAFPAPHQTRESVTPRAERTYESLYKETYPFLYTYSRRRCATTADAEDLVATTYLIAWKNADAFVGADFPLAWLYAVANKTLSNHSRTRRTHLSLDVWLEANDLSEAHGTEAIVEQRLALEMAYRALERLRNRDQGLIRLAALEGLSHEEIAAVISSTEARVKSDLFRARVRLKDAYTREQKRRQGKNASKGPGDD